MFKKFLKILLLLAILSASVVLFLGKIPKAGIPLVEGIDIPFLSEPCAEPLKYTIGTIDPQFGLGRDEFKNTIQQAEDIWEKASGKNLFQYDETATLKINLVYDERQAETLEAEGLEAQLKKMESTHDQMSAEYKALYDQYSNRMKAYKANWEKYEKRLENYKEAVAYWNKRGGAPEDEYKDLQKEKDKLEDIFSNLEKERKAINQLAVQVNSLASKSNKVANNYNQNLETYNNKFGEAREFEKGVFNGSEINIYQFKEQTDLRLVLAHELGHALGIGHLENSTSIMYYLMSEQNLDDPQPTEEDMAALRGICKL